MIVAAPDAALLKALALIHAAAFAEGGPRPWGAGEIGTLAAAPGGCLIVDDPAAPAGFLLLRRAADEAEVLTVAVDPGQWNKGIGRALLGCALGWCAAHGVARAFLEVDEANARASRLYARHGFVAVGRRRAYFGAGGDALLMAKDLSSPNSTES